MTIRINQPRFKLRVLCEILCVLCGTKTAGTQSTRRKIQHKGHKADICGQSFKIFWIDCSRMVLKMNA